MMMTLPTQVFRVARGIHAKTTADALSGKGGVLAPGRWNSEGKPIVYTSLESSTCLLERLVHGDELIAERHPDLMMMTIALPAVSSTYYTASELSAADPHWQAEGNPTCQHAGDMWLDGKGSCALIVPSAANIHTMNILLNPQHEDFTQILAANDPLQAAKLEPDERVVSLAKRYRAAAPSKP